MEAQQGIRLGKVKRSSIMNRTAITKTYDKPELVTQSGALNSIEGVDKVVATMLEAPRLGFYEFTTNAYEADE